MCAPFSFTLLGTTMRLASVAVLTVLLHTFAVAATPPTTSRLNSAIVDNVGQARYTDGTPVEHVSAVLELPQAKLYLHPTGMHVLQDRVAQGQDGDGLVLDLLRYDIDLVGANSSAPMEAAQLEDGFVRFIHGNTPKGNVARRMSKVVFHDVYPGIDREIIQTTRGIKVNYIVEPGADASLIALVYRGAGIELNEDGLLEVSTELGSMIEKRPVAFTGDGTQVPVSFKISGQRVTFDLGDYDRTQTLTIDPDRLWATYYGGNGVMDDCYTSFDDLGDVFIAGTTFTRNLPISPGALQTRYRARADGYAAKFRYDGTFLWHTYVGGTGTDRVRDAKVDERGYLWMVGELDSSNSPIVVLNNGGSGVLLMNEDTVEFLGGFVMRLDHDGAWADSWIVDGPREEAVTGIDFAGNRMAFVGWTRSARVGDIQGDPFAHNPGNDSLYMNRDMFVCAALVLDGQGYRWERDWLSYFGGSVDDEGHAVGITAAGRVYAFGRTRSDDLQVTNGTAYKDNSDIFGIRFNTPTKANPVRVWATYYGTNGNERIYDCDMDNNGNPVIVGYTTGTGLPLANPISNTLGGFADGYIARFNQTTGGLDFSTYYGGSEGEFLYSVSAGNTIWVAGETQGSEDLLVTNDAYQDEPYNDPDYTLSDGFFAQINNSGIPVYSTYYGAPPQDNLPPPPGENDPPLDPDVDFGNDFIFGIDVDNDAYIALASKVAGLRMETTQGAFVEATELNNDTVKQVNFLSLFSNCPDTAIEITPNGPPTLCADESRQLLAPNGFAKYRWSLLDSLDVLDSVRVITVDEPGDYVVMCTDFQGCRFRDTITISASPQPTVSAGNDTTGCLNTLIRLTATPSGGTPPYSYKWRRIESGPSFIDDDTLRSPGVNPNSTSNYEVTVTDSAGCTDVDTVEVSVIDPRPTVVPTTWLDFGTLDACESSREATVFIKNPMPYEISVSGSTPDGPQIEVVTALDPPLEIAAGDSVEITLRVSPSSDGTTNGTIEITGQPCDWSLTVNYTVEKARLLATILPGTLDFGTHPNCEEVEVDTFTVIRNGGTDPLVLSVGSVPAPFEILAPTSEVTIAPGDTIHARIRFAPTAAGNYDEVASFPFVSGTCDDTLRVTVRGRLQTLTVIAFPASIDYGTLEGCEDEKSDTVLIQNTGTLDATISFPTDPEVVFDPPGPIQLRAGDSVEVVITIRPAAAGPFSKMVNADVQPCDGELLFSLSAQKNGIAFTTPSQIDIGELNSCLEAARTETFDISFDGTGTATVESVTLGENLSTSLASGTQLESGVSQTFEVTWTPSVDGALVDSMVIIFQPCDVRRVVRLTGVRTTPSLTAVQPAIDLGAINNDADWNDLVHERWHGHALFVEVQTSANAQAVDVRPPAGTQILPGEQIEVDYLILCVPVINDTIRLVTTQECVLSAETVFTGTCENLVPEVSAVVVIDTVGVNTGDRFLLPMRLTESLGLGAAGPQRWEADITYNPMVVVAVGNTPDCFEPGEYAPCTITISGTANDTVGTLYELDLTAVLGNAERTDVVISEFRWVDLPEAQTTTQDGHIVLLDICNEGGVRLLDPKSEAFNIRVYPIPASYATDHRCSRHGQ